MRRILRRREFVPDGWRYLGEELAEGRRADRAARRAARRARALVAGAAAARRAFRPRRGGRGSRRGAAAPAIWSRSSFPAPARGAATRSGRLLRERLGFRGELRAVGAGVRQDRCSCSRAAASTPSSSPRARTSRRRAARSRATTSPTSRAPRAVALRRQRLFVKRSALRQRHVGEHARALPRRPRRGARARPDAGPGAAPAAARSRTCTCAAACRGGSRSRWCARQTGARHRSRRGPGSCGVDRHVRDDADAEPEAHVGLDDVRVARRDGDVGREPGLGEGLVQRGRAGEAEGVGDERIGGERLEGEPPRARERVRPAARSPCGASGSTAAASGPRTAPPSRWRWRSRCDRPPPSRRSAPRCPGAG